MFRSLFNPAIWLMGRMRYPYKFMMMGGVAMLIVLILALRLYGSLSHDAQHADMKAQAAPVIETMSRLIQAIQQHRGMSSGVLSGNDTLRERRAGKEREVDEIMKSLEPRFSPAMLASAEWKSVVGWWERLKTSGLQMQVRDNFVAHTSLIDQLLIFEIAVSDEADVTFDSNIDSFYLIDTAVTKLPFALERLGQIRARGTGILTRKQISEVEKIEIAANLAELNGSLKFLGLNLEKAARHNPAIASRLQSAAREINSSSEQIIKLVGADIIGGVFATPPKSYFDSTTAVIDGAYDQMYEVLLPTMKSLMEARSEQARNELLVMVGLCLLGFVTLSYLGLGAYYSTVDSLAAVVSGARHIAGGDLTVRINVQTEDEHKQVGQSFNDMAAAFAELLGSVQQGARRVLETSFEPGGSEHGTAEPGCCRYGGFHRGDEHRGR